jgi:hypothetical protein
MGTRNTPEKKEAMRLYRLFRGFNTDGNEQTNRNTAIQCASIHIDELVDVINTKLDFRNIKTINFYIDVKHELFNIK